MNQTIDFTMSGPDLLALFRAVFAWFPDTPKEVGDMDGKLEDPAPDAEGLVSQIQRLRLANPRYLHVRFEDWLQALTINVKTVKGRRLAIDTTPRRVLPRLTDIPFSFATITTEMSGPWRHDFNYEPEVPLSGHDPHGLYCAIKGQAGHDHLASRRLLEYGPWRLLRDEQHDLSLVQFYDHEETDPETAAEQAVDGHDLLSDLDGGCFGTDGRYGYRNQIRGFYVAAQRQLRIVVHGRELPYSEMLDACALRYYRRDDPDEPLDSVAFVFMDPAEADKYLHDLWLRELQCWTIIDGQEVRLDADYHPTPVKPDWVAEVEAREAAAG